MKIAEYDRFGRNPINDIENSLSKSIPINTVKTKNSSSNLKNSENTY